MNVAEKVRIAEQLEKLNVDIIEAGFPISSEGDFEAVKEIAKTVRRSQVVALARTDRQDIDRAWEAVRFAKFPAIHTFIATSDIHLKHKLRKTHQEVLNEASKAVRYAKTLCENVEFSAEDATRSDLDFLCQVLSVIIGAPPSIFLT
jgi:2-isopropylmalate synthase